MKITMYELLGLVKDGKAPKKIKVYGKVYINNNCSCYLDEQDKSLCNNVEIPMFLNDEIEILELEEEKKIPEKIKLQIHHSNLSNLTLHEEQLEKNDNTLVDCFKEVEKKINSIIDYLKSKGE